MVSLKTNAGKGHLTHGNLADRLNQIQSDLPRLKGLIRASLIEPIPFYVKATPAYLNRHSAKIKKPTVLSNRRLLS
jgi:hypothetical protein